MPYVRTQNKCNFMQEIIDDFLHIFLIKDIEVEEGVIL